MLHMTPPSFEAVRAAVTQAEATALATPNVRGADLDCSLMVLLLPLLAWPLPVLPPLYPALCMLHPSISLPLPVHPPL